MSNERIIYFLSHVPNNTITPNFMLSALVLINHEMRWNAIEGFIIYQNLLYFYGYQIKAILHTPNCLLIKKQVIFIASSYKQQFVIRQCLVQIRSWVSGETLLVVWHYVWANLIIASHAVVFRGLVLPPPHKRLLTQAPHSFPPLSQSQWTF